MQKTTLHICIPVLLAFLLVLAACGGKGHAVEAVRDNIRLKLSTDQSVYEPGQLVVVIATVENVSSSPVHYTMWNIGDPPIYIGVDTSPFGGQQCLEEEDFQQRLLLPSVTSDVLQPQQSITRRVVWDQRIHTSPVPIQAPSGKYPVQVQFFAGLYSANSELQSLTLTLEVEIRGAGEIITADQAYTAALAVADVRKWYDEHSGPNVVKGEGGRYYLLFNGDWREISQPAYNEYLGYVPESAVSMTEQAWEVRFFTKMGLVPHEMYVKVDPATGKVLEWTSK